MKILLVDDYIEDRKILESVLSIKGFTVVTADNGVEALKILKGNSIELIVSDILMPVMDGFQLCKACKSDEKLRHIPFIIHTGTYTDTGDEELAYLMGADKFLRKPASETDFVEIIFDCIYKAKEVKIIPKKVELDETKALTLYNEALIRKLEHKMRDLEVSEKKYRLICENINDVIFKLDTEGKFIDVNCRIELIGYTKEDVLGRYFYDFMTPKSREIALGHFSRAKEQPEFKILYEAEVVKKDGGTAILELNMSSLVEEGKFAGRFGVARDITERKRAEEEILRINRALLMVSRCNEELVQAEDETKLLQDICRTVVGVGGYRMAWVGFAEKDEACSVRPAAYAGYEEGYLETAKITYKNDERGQEPTGRAIRSGKPVICRNMLTDPTYAPWREEAVKRGYFSSLALPLMQENQAFGSLNIYAGAAEAFDDKEEELLIQLADDLSYGIKALRTAAQRKQAEETLQESELLYRSVFDNAPVGWGITDKKGKIITYNKEMLRQGGFTELDIAKMGNVKEYYYDKKEKIKIFRRLKEKGFVNKFPVRFKRRDGSFFEALLSLSAIVIKGETKWLVLVEDISERIKAEIAVQESEKKYRKLFDDSLDGIFLTNYEGKMLDVNEAGIKEFGCTREEILHKNAAELYADIDGRSKFLQHIAQEGFVKDYEVDPEKIFNYFIIKYLTLSF